MYTYMMIFIYLTPAFVMIWLLAKKIRRRAARLKKVLNRDQENVYHSSEEAAGNPRQIPENRE